MGPVKAGVSSPLSTEGRISSVPVRGNCAPFCSKRGNICAVASGWRLTLTATELKEQYERRPPFNGSEHPTLQND